MSADLHPTAVVAATAVLGEGCRIGPYCVVGGDVRIGDGTRLHEHAVVDGHTTIGRECEIFPFACIGKQTQDLKYAGGVAFVEIGARTTLREYVTVHAATVSGGRTVVGSDCHILAYCHIAHECLLGNGIVMSNATQLAGHVTVEDDVVFGGMAGVHQFVRIGRMAMVSATAKVVQDVVPFCLVDGHPALPVTVNKIGMQRHGLSRQVITTVEDAFRTLFHSNLTLDAAVAELRNRGGDSAEVQQMLAFVESSERGLARPKSAKR